MVEQTYEILLDAICSGELAPGERLTQDEIAGRLNVSRQPVNSAISILKANKLVEDTGRRGVVVSAIEPDQFRSIYEYRSVIEPFAVELASQRLANDAADEAQLVLRKGQRALKTKGIRELLQADVEFHEMLYRWSGNQVIESSMRINWQHMRRSMAQVLRDPSSAISSWVDHDRIIASLLNGNPEAAALYMKGHIERAQEKTMRTLLAIR